MSLVRLGANAGWRHCAGGVLIAGILLLAAYWIDRPPPDVLLRPGELVAMFEKAVFAAGEGRSSTAVAKWTRPVRVQLRGDPKPGAKERLDQYLFRLHLYSGLDIVAAPKERPNVHIHFLPMRQFPTVLPSAERIGPDGIRVFADAECLARVGRDWGRIYGATVAVSTDLQSEGRSCLMRKLVHVLGFHDLKEGPTILARKDDLTLNDKLLIRTLYDDRMAPRMERAEAMRVARKVISELVERFAAEGEAALVHPHYRGSFEVRERAGS